MSKSQGLVNQAVVTAIGGLCLAVIGVDGGIDHDEFGADAAAPGRSAMALMAQLVMSGAPHFVWLGARASWRAGTEYPGRMGNGMPEVGATDELRHGETLSMAIWSGSALWLVLRREGRGGMSTLGVRRWGGGDWQELAGPDCDVHALLSEDARSLVLVSRHEVQLCPVPTGVGRWPIVRLEAPADSGELPPVRAVKAHRNRRTGRPTGLEFTCTNATQAPRQHASFTCPDDSRLHVRVGFDGVAGNPLAPHIADRGALGCFPVRGVRQGGVGSADAPTGVHVQVQERSMVLATWEPKTDAETWPQYDVFISYSHGDSTPFARAIRDGLRKHNFVLFFDTDRQLQMYSDGNFITTCIDALESSRSAIILWDSRSEEQDPPGTRPKFHQWNEINAWNTICHTGERRSFHATTDATYSPDGGPSHKEPPTLGVGQPLVVLHPFDQRDIDDFVSAVANGLATLRLPPSEM